MTEGGKAISQLRVALRAYRSQRSIATGTCMRDPTIAVAPVSLMISGTKSPCRSRKVSAKACNSRALSAGGVRHHAGKAS